MTNEELFIETYKEQLKIAHSLERIDYAWPIEQFDEVFERMTSAIKRRCFHNGSLAFKMTAKKLGIKNTYKEIYAFLDQRKELENGK